MTTDTKTRHSFSRQYWDQKTRSAARLALEIALDGSLATNEKAALLHTQTEILRLAVKGYGEVEK